MPPWPGPEPSRSADLLVSGLRGLLIGLPTDYWLDFGVLIAAATAGIVSSAALLPRLAR